MVFSCEFYENSLLPEVCMYETVQILQTSGGKNSFYQVSVSLPVSLGEKW